jgi:hypothetical protein
MSEIRVAAPFVCPTMQGFIGEIVKPRTSKTVKTQTYSRGILAAGDRGGYFTCV